MIEARQRTMFWAPTRKRHYAKLTQACLAEAGAIVKREWYDEGGEGHWTNDEDYLIRRAKLAAALEAQAKAPK